MVVTAGGSVPPNRTGVSAPGHASSLQPMGCGASSWVTKGLQTISGEPRESVACPELGSALSAAETKERDGPDSVSDSHDKGRGGEECVTRWIGGTEQETKEIGKKYEAAKEVDQSDADQDRPKERQCGKKAGTGRGEGSACEKDDGNQRGDGGGIQ